MYSFGSSSPNKTSTAWSADRRVNCHGWVSFRCRSLSVITPSFPVAPMPAIDGTDELIIFMFSFRLKGGVHLHFAKGRMVARKGYKERRINR